MLSLLYLVVRALVGFLVGGGQQGRDDGSKDLEILVLRHRPAVLQVLRDTTGGAGAISDRGDSRE